MLFGLTWFFFWTSYYDINSYFKSAVKNPLETVCELVLGYTLKKWEVSMGLELWGKECERKRVGNKWKSTSD